MKIELKNLEINLKFSEETVMFMADIFVDGVKVAFAKNDGRGGCTDYHPYPSKINELLKAEEYAKSLPQQSFKMGDKTHYIDSTLELLIDSLVDEKVKENELQRFRKSIQKKLDSAIVYGKPNGTTVKIVKFKGVKNLSALKNTQLGRLALQKAIDNITAKLEEGEVIFNENLV